jgi:hypothetical protein
LTISSSSAAVWRAANAPMISSGRSYERRALALAVGVRDGVVQGVVPDDAIDLAGVSDPDVDEAARIEARARARAGRARVAEGLRRDAG